MALCNVWVNCSSNINHFSEEESDIVRIAVNDSAVQNRRNRYLTMAWEKAEAGLKM